MMALTWRISTESGSEGKSDAITDMSASAFEPASQFDSRAAFQAASRSFAADVPASSTSSQLAAIDAASSSSISV